MMNRALILLPALLSCACAGHSSPQSYPWPEYEVEDFASFTAYFEAMIPHVETAHDPSQKEASFAHFGAQAVQEVEPYLTHENRMVRLSAHGHLLTFLWLAEESRAKQSMFLTYIQGLEDRDELIRQTVAERMNTFGTSIYSREAKDFVLAQLRAGEKNYHTFKHVVLATGMAGIRSAAPVLRTLDSWHALAALARMGDDASLQRLLDRMPKIVTAEQMDNLLYEKMRVIAYTKRPGAIDLLKTYLWTSAYLPGGNDYPATSIAHWSAGLLSSILKGCPSDVAACRIWMDEYYDPNALDRILGGEIDGRP